MDTPEEVEWAARPFAAELQTSDSGTAATRGLTERGDIIHALRG
jgi:hypothetical protein